MSMSDYLEEKLLLHTFKNTAYTSPTTVYLSLHTADPGETGASECTGGSYARQAIAFSAASNPAGTIANSGTVTFSSMPAATVTHFAIWDASSAGNCLITGALGSSKTVGAGDTVSFAASSVVITFS